MSLWRLLGSRLRPLRPGSSPVLRQTRLRRLIRCYREFLGLFVDAAEKQGEGFILDRQYVVSLVERAFRLGYEIVFHANVLCPAAALDSYALLDRLKVAIRDLLAGETEPLGGRLPLQVAGHDTASGKPAGSRPPGAAEPGNRPAASPPAPETAPALLGEARRHRLRLIENEGYVASPGVASGRLCLIRSEADLQHFPDAGVLVAARLEPTAALLRALPRVAAMLVEEAMPTDPIAVVARSFRVPTLLGVAGAAMRLPPGEPVTVDATDRTVYSGVFEELRLHHLRHGGSGTEEPEYRLLNGVVRELGSPLCAAALPGNPPGDRQTLYGIVQRVWSAALDQLAASLMPRREGVPLPAPGCSGGIRTVDLSAQPPAAGGELPGTAGIPDPSAWLLAGLTAPQTEAETMPVTPAARALLYRSEEATTALLLLGDRLVLLDAVVGGVEGGHVMLWAGQGRAGGGGTGLDRMQAEAARLGLVAVCAADTIAAWRERIPCESIQETLTGLGRLARHTGRGTAAAGQAAG